MSDFTNQQLTELAEAAFREVAKDVVKRAIDTNTPVIVWQDGKIVRLDPRSLLPTNDVEQVQCISDSVNDHR